MVFANSTNKSLGLFLLFLIYVFIVIIIYWPLHKLIGLEEYKQNGPEVFKSWKIVYQ